MTFVARFLFVSESEDYTDELFKDPYIQKHSKVAAVRKVFGPEEHFINFGYNFFKPGTLIPTFVWSPKKFMKSRDIIFTPNDDFQGFQFDVNKFCHSHLLTLFSSCGGAALVTSRPRGPGGRPRGRPGHLHQLLGLRDRASQVNSRGSEFQV